MRRRDLKIRQHDQSDCGAACLASLCSYYGRKVPIFNIRQICGTDREGTTLKGVVDAAITLGFHAKALKSNDKVIESLMKIPKPAILHLKKENGWLHFVVIEKVSKKSVTIMDPEDGVIRKISNESLKEQWTGYVILVVPGDTISMFSPPVSTNIRFFRLVYQNRKLFFNTLKAALIYMLISLSTSLFLQQIIDKVLPLKNEGMLLFVIGSMTFLMLFILVLSYYKNLFILRNTVIINSSLILNYLKKVFRLPLSFFHSRSDGEINARIGDAFKIGNFLSGSLISIIISSFTLIFSLIVLFIFNRTLALITTMFIPFYAVLYYFTNRVNKKTNRRIMESAAKFEEINIRNLAAIENAIYYNSPDYFVRMAEKECINMHQNIYDGGNKMIGFSVGSDLISRTLTIIILLMGSLLVFQANLTVGELVSFFTLTTFFSAPLMNLVNSSYEITESKIAAERLFEIIDQESINNSVVPMSDYDLSSCGIEFKNVCFEYKGRAPLFENISFSIPKGRITLLSGVSGSGKSTIASLLMRTCTPSSGIIKIGDIDINSFDVSLWREHISIVPQKPQLFNSSLLENITLSEKKIDLNHVISICKEVGIIELIERLPHGIMTSIGEHGSYLSGGEQQRIALARVLYREPKILILDEPTSSLDVDCKEFINNLIRRLKNKGITIILITHDRDSSDLAENSIEIDKLNVHSKVNTTYLKP